MGVAITGVSAINARGDLALLIQPLPSGCIPTSVSQAENRLAVMSAGRPVSVRGYSSRASNLATRRKKALVVEIDEISRKPVRVTAVPVEAE